MMQAEKMICPGRCENDTVVEVAISAVKSAAQRLCAGEPSVPFSRPTDLMPLSSNDQEIVLRGEAAYYRNQPTSSAMNFCLASSLSLLSIVRTLLNQPVNAAPADRATTWKKLAEDTKVAGRAAYRASLILSDPASRTESIELRPDDAISRLETAEIKNNWLTARQYYRIPGCIGIGVG